MVKEKRKEELISDSSDLPWGDETADDSAQLQNLPWGDIQTRYRDVTMPRTLLWPVAKGRISSGYGIRGGRQHEGLDIAAPRGTPIRSVAAGVVVFSGNINGYGRTVVVYHGSGTASVYAHNSQNLKSEGSRVSKGDAIAKVGSTGKSTGNHLHFEIRKRGIPMNPLMFEYAESPMVASR